MRGLLTRFFNALWYARSPASLLFVPLSWLFGLIVVRRRRAYLSAIASQTLRMAPIVVVVGNISVGGAGKTPLVIALARDLSARGHKPGIVLRGYGARGIDGPILVDAGHGPDQVGDEALVIREACGLPVAVCPRRQEAVDALAACGVTLVIADDGLQHYAMPRHIEIAVVDGGRCFGNGLLLPAGPLREPKDRLNSVDHVVVNGGDCGLKTHSMSLRPGVCVRLFDGAQCELHAFVGKRVRVVAGIGNPARLFDSLRELGLDIIECPFPDHHRYTAADLVFDDAAPLLMTAKDAVKCRRFAPDDSWLIEPVVEVSPALFEAVHERIAQLSRST